jgi:ADP-ribose diphosphatase
MVVCKKPILSNIKNIATTQFFNIQGMDVAFSNGEKRQYERLKPDGDGAVLVVPMLDDDTTRFKEITHWAKIGFC